MIQYIFSLVLVSALYAGNAQNSAYTEKFDSLQTVKNKLQDELTTITFQIDSLKTLRILEREQTAMNIMSRISRSAKLYSAPYFGSNIVSHIKKYDIVTVIAAERGFFKVHYLDNIGFVDYLCLDLNDELRAIINRSKEIDKLTSKERMAVEKKAKEIQVAEKRELTELIEEIQSIYEQTPAWIKTPKANLRSGNSEESEIIASLDQGSQVFIQSIEDKWAKVKFKQGDIHSAGYYPSLQEFEVSYTDAWIYQPLLNLTQGFQPSYSDLRRVAYLENNPDIPERFRILIMSGRVTLGMTKDMVRASLGDPDDINRTVTTSNISEQWVYGSFGSAKYLYFDNGILTVFQD